MLKDEASLCQYLPEWFREIGEFQQLCQAGTNLAETLLDDVQAVRADFFFLTMDAGTVAAWEHDLRIVANPSVESLDFRRRRLLHLRRAAFCLMGCKIIPHSAGDSILPGFPA